VPVEQLQTLGEQIGVPVYSEKTNPVDVCRNAVAQAKKSPLRHRHPRHRRPAPDRRGADGGAEGGSTSLVKPDECYLVVDAMIGQEAANVAKAFNDALELNACILTKLDGDARGGAAMSIKGVTGVPVKFVRRRRRRWTSSKTSCPSGWPAGSWARADLMGVVEKIARVQQEISAEELQRQQEKMQKGNFTLDDFRKQFEMIAKRA